MRFGISFALSRLSRVALSRRAIRRLADLCALAVETSGFGGCPSQRWSRMSAVLLAVAVKGNRAAPLPRMRAAKILPSVMRPLEFALTSQPVNSA